jgi:hypothetical protein
MLPDFIKAKKMLFEQQQKFFSFALKQAAGEFFKQIPQTPIYEGDQMKQKYPDGLVHETEIRKLSSGFSLSFQEIKENPSVIYEHLQSSAKEMADQQMKMMIDAINTVTERTGNIVSGKITPESILEIWQKMEVAFDEHGNPIKYQILTSPEMAKKMQEVLIFMESDEGYKSRMKEIIDIKRKEWNDRENNRKLVE